MTMPNNNVDPAFAQKQNLSLIQKDIKALSGALAKANERIHELAIRCMEHARNYGDVMNTAAALVDAMPLSLRRSLVINWFAAFSPIVVAKDGKTGKMKAHLKGTREERDGLWNIEAAKATPFYAMPEAQREPDVPTYDSVHDNVVSFIKRIEKKASEIADEEGKNKALAEVAKLKASIAA